VRDGREMISSVIASQIATHTRFGGVVPNSLRVNTSTRLFQSSKKHSTRAKPQ